jgi:hypothetical protein
MKDKEGYIIRDQSKAHLLPQLLWIGLMFFQEKHIEIA